MGHQLPLFCIRLPAIATVAMLTERAPCLHQAACLASASASLDPTAMDRSMRKNTTDNMPRAPTTQWITPAWSRSPSVPCAHVLYVPAWMLCVSYAPVDQTDRGSARAQPAVRWHRACSGEGQHRSRPVLGGDITPSPRREAQVASRTRLSPVDPVIALRAE